VQLKLKYIKKENQIDETSLPDFQYLMVAPSFDRPQIRKRISERLHQRLEEGMVEEVQLLLSSGVDAQKLISYGLEYKFLTWYIQNQITYDEMVEKLNVAIHQFAKRQMTWFRRMQRKGIKIHWIDGYLPMQKKVDLVLKLYQNLS
jgi:tRNA dimethylallyltransferase